MNQNDFSDLGGSPIDYSDLGGTPIQDQSQQDQPQGFLQSLASSAPVEFTLGAGDAVRNQAIQLANVLKSLNIPSNLMSASNPALANLIPKTRIPFQETGDKDTLSYQLGNVAGDIAGYMAGGETLGAGRLAAEGLPYIGKLAAAAGKGIPAAAARTLGAGGYGAMMSPEDRTSSGLGSAATNLAFETLPPVFKGIAKASKLIRPQLIADEIKQTLSPASIKSVKEEGKSLYNRVFNSIPDSSIYAEQGLAKNIPLDKVHGIKGTSDKYVKYTDINEEQLKDIYNSKLKKVHDLFVEEPTAKNAHSLQSQLAEEIRKYGTKEARLGALDQADRKIKDSYEFARFALQKDIRNFLGKNNPELLGKYSEANANWARNVTPQRQAAVTLRKLGGNPTPEKIAKAFEKQEIKNVPIHPSLQGKLEDMKSKIANKELAQKGAGFALGYKMFPRGLAEIAGGLTGASLASPVMRSLSGKFPDLSSLLSSVGRKGYEGTRTATLANLYKLLGGNQ
jgi:hypothetical protein